VLTGTFALGGHHENLGIWPLLERRCRLIVVADATQDGPGQPGEEKKEDKKEPPKASTSNAAKALLEKYMRRPR